VLDDDAGTGPEVGLQEGIRPLRVAGDDVDARIVQPARERALFHDELDLEARQQNLVEHPDDEFVLTDG
jgi:hypothetical protein